MQIYNLCSVIHDTAKCNIITNQNIDVTLAVNDLNIGVCVCVHDSQQLEYVCV